MDQSDSDCLRRIDGLFLGLLDADEMKVLDRLCKQGTARVTYEGAAGFLGLGRVRATTQQKG